MNTRLSKSVSNNLCVLSLINSIVEQMNIHRDQYTPDMRNLHDELRVAHRDARKKILELANIKTSEKGLMLLSASDLRRWMKKEKAFFDAVIKNVPERTLDARMWVTAVLLVTEDFAATIPDHAETHRKLWDGLSSTLASIYVLYDPGYRCKQKMRDGMNRGTKILEMLA